MSCAMVCNVIRFVLRHFLGFLACFYLFTLQLIHFSKIWGLEWLKICFCCSGIRIVMLLRYNKRGFAGYYARAHVCINIYTYLISVLFNKLSYLNTLTHKLKFS